MDATAQEQEEFDLRERLCVDPTAALLIERDRKRGRSRHYLCSPQGHQRVLFETDSNGRTMIANARAVGAFLDARFVWERATLSSSGNNKALWLTIDLDDGQYGSPYVQVVAQAD
jgi:hypothetical protein